MLDENQIVDAVCLYFENKGYEVLQKLTTHEKGIDIIVRNIKTGNKILIEAKGGTSSFIDSNRFENPIQSLKYLIGYRKEFIRCYRCILNVDMRKILR